DVEIAQHGERCGHSAGGGVGENGDVGDVSGIEAGQSGGDFCHLHQADHAFHHAGAAGGGNDDDRCASRDRLLDGTGDGFAHDTAHAAADEGILHGADDHRAALEFAAGVDDGIFQPSVFFGLLQARGVGFQIDKLQRVGGGEVAVEDFVLIVVEK